MFGCSGGQKHLKAGLKEAVRAPSGKARWCKQHILGRSQSPMM
jgi:hypothetical protein